MFELNLRGLGRSGPRCEAKGRRRPAPQLYDSSIASNGDLFEDLTVGDYLAEAERHGIPQARHRVILVGVRDDLVASATSVDHRLPRVKETPSRRVLDRLPALRIISRSRRCRVVVACAERSA